MKGIVLSALIVMTFFVPTMAHEIKGKVIEVIDGNTVQVAGDDRETYRLLLDGIDSPELDQSYGMEAKTFLERMILGKSVIVKLVGKDRRGNSLAEVMIKGKKDPRIELLKAGLAWTSEKNPLADLESHRINAQLKGNGLWKHENPMPPWIYRRKQTMLQAKSS